MRDQNPLKQQNKNPFNFYEKLKYYFGSANSDSDIEFIGQDEENGIRIDGLNGRMASNEGGTGAFEKILGEVLLYDLSASIDNTYECVLATEIGGYLLCIFASSVGTNDAIITLNDQIVCKNSALGFYVVNNTGGNLKYDVNNNTLGGEIYIVDGELTPIYFSISDIWSSRGTQKYFSEFIRAEYEINLQVPSDNIVFDQLVPVGAGGGIPTGNYSYRHHYVSKSGDSSSWSPFTPCITVPDVYIATEDAIAVYPFLNTIGKDPSPTFNGGYGVQLRFRINNYLNYDYIEIQRVAYNTGGGIGYSPTPFIISRIALSPSQFEVYTFVDSIANENTVVASTIEAQSGLASIKTANSVRYFYNKVVLGGITYNSREVKPNDFSFIKNAGVTKFAPIIKDLGRIGCKGDFFSTYNQPYMNDEAYSFEIVFWDSQFFKSFATPIPALSNYIFPSRRTVMSDQYSIDNSTGVVTCSVKDNTINKCFECVDYTDLIAKPFSTLNPFANPQRNILNGDTKNMLFQASTANGASGDGKWLNEETYFWDQTPNKYGFLPSYPAFVGDRRNNYNDFPVNNKFDEHDSVGTGTAPNSPVVTIDVDPYSPFLFAPRYNSLGLAIAGLDTYPDWATSFSIVRTPRAGRVVCQGLAFYSLIDYLATNQTLLGRQSLTPPTGPYGTDDFIGYDCKEKNQIALHLPDFENGNLDPAILEDIRNNPQDYSIQMVAPFGLGNETIAKELVNDPTQLGVTQNADPFQKSDICAYARVMGEFDSTSKRINPTGDATRWGLVGGANGTSNQDSYVGFGKWKNTTVPSYGGNTTGQHLFGITSFLDDTSNPTVSSLFKVQLSDDLYSSKLFYYVGDDYTDFTEPVYIVNIVKTGASTSVNSSQKLIQTGSFIKIKSLVGISDGTASRYEMCGERVEDFCSFYSQADDNYIYVDVNNNATPVRYIDITYKSGPQIIAINAAISSSTPYNGVLLFGTYTVDLINTIYANGQNLPKIVVISTAYIPANNCKIYVYYDNRYAIKIFGGDSFVGEAVAPIVMRTAGETHNNTSNQYHGGSGVSGSGPLGDLACIAGFPYNNQQISRSIIIARFVSGSSNQNSQDSLPSQPSITFDNVDGLYASIRQLLCMYTCQCYFPVQLSYADCFPLVSYVQRPYQYDPTLKPSEQNIFPEYEATYPTDYASWAFGGFHVGTQQVNTDYMKQTSHDVYVQNGGVAFKENTYFPNRVIWSLTRPIEIYSSPNLKSFNSLNIFDISDQYGAISLLYSCISDIGENLYAFCYDNICELLTRKRTITDVNGETIGQIGVTDNEFITEQKWRGDRRVGGLPDDFWRSFSENGNEAFFYNRNSVYKFINGTVVDLLEEFKYFKRVKNSLIKRIGLLQVFNGDHLRDKIVGIYDKKKSEYLFGARLKKKQYTFTRGSIGAINFDTPSRSDQSDTLYVSSSVTGIGNFTVQATISGSESPVYIVNNGVNPFIVKIGSLIILSSLPAGKTIQINLVNGNYTGRIIDDSLICRDNYLFSFVNKKQVAGFNGIFSYNFEKYISSYDSRDLYGVKNSRIYTLDYGYLINGVPIVYQAIQSATPIPNKSLEFARIRISATNKPTKVYFFDKDDICVSVASMDNLKLKNYNSFENYIPGRTEDHSRFQDKFLTYKIEHSDQSDFKVNFVGVQFKIIK